MGRDKYILVLSPLKIIVLDSKVRQEIGNSFTKYNGIKTNVSPDKSEMVAKIEEAKEHLYNKYGDQSNETSFLGVCTMQADMGDMFFKLSSKDLLDISVPNESTLRRRSKSHEAIIVMDNNDSLNKVINSLPFQTKIQLSEINDIPPIHESIIEMIKPKVPLQRKCKKLLVIDLDETLVCSLFINIGETFQFKIASHTVYCKVRPHAYEVLTNLHKYYDIYVFTASVKEYADKVLDRFDKNNIIMGRLYRNNCAISGQHFVKDLRVIGRDLKSVVLVDNSICCLAAQPDNGIPIKSYYGNNTDDELLKLQKFLIEIADDFDVRTRISETFMVRKLSSYYKSRYNSISK